jgi:hypothetical protein
MKITPFFVDLHAAYLAELDDLSLDSEQNNVLARRLADKRKQMAFLVQMMEMSPEMVAVVFHGAFEFRLPAVMDDLLGQQAENFPQWAFVTDSVRLAPWAEPLAAVVLKEPQGEWFMTVAAALEYMASRSAAAGASASRDEAEDDDSEQDDGQDDDQRDDQDEGAQDADSRAAREAGADWLVAQGFDRKD